MKPIKEKDYDYERRKLFKLVNRQANLNKIKNKGYVYLLERDDKPGWLKVGQTTDLYHRLSGYKSEYPDSSCSFVYTLKSNYKVRVEMLAILYFNQSIKALNEKKEGHEWFKLNLKFASSMIDLLSTQEITVLNLYDYSKLDTMKGYNKNEKET